ncbi:MAG TPA: lysophospholipid acyltransferase family protein [Acidimicrobiales bacterium]|nr:lysophospholipid acyltransferase family protein [Acidimicrobiales bacterium]
MPATVLVRQAEQERLCDRDPAFIRRLAPLIARYAGFFQPEVRGIEHLPETGPVLLVGNHSSTAYMPDMWITTLAVLGWRGLGQPAYVLTHNLFLSLPGLRSILARLGCIPADRAQAEAALADKALVLVYPGGDYEACRPWSDRDRIDFAGRQGFVRLALRSGAPVVPVVAQGAQHTVVVLSRGQGMARAFGLGRLRVKVFPIMVGPPFGVTPIPPLPMPAAITVEFLPHLDWSGFGPEAADDQAVVDACYKEITGLMQATLDRLSADHPHPLRRGVAQLLHHGPAHIEVPVS